MKFIKVVEDNLLERKAIAIQKAIDCPELVEAAIRCDELSTIIDKFPDTEEALLFTSICLGNYYTKDLALNQKECLFCESQRVEQFLKCTWSGCATKEGIRTFSGFNALEMGISTFHDTYHPSCKNCIDDILSKRRTSTLVKGICFFLLFPSILAALFFGGKVLFMGDSKPILATDIMDWMVFSVSMLVIFLSIVLTIKMEGRELPICDQFLSKKCFTLFKFKRVE